MGGARATNVSKGKVSQTHVKKTEVSDQIPVEQKRAEHQQTMACTAQCVMMLSSSRQAMHTQDTPNTLACLSRIEAKEMLYELVV